MLHVFGRSDVWYADSRANRVMLFDFCAGMSLQEWVEMRSQELQTKEKERRMGKGQPAGTAGSRGSPEQRTSRGENSGEQQGPMSEAGGGGSEAEEAVEVEVPLVRKRRKLVKTGEGIAARDNVSAEEARPIRGVAEQRVWEPVGGEGSVAREGSRLGDGGEEGQTTLPLVLVPFGPVTEEELAAQRKQAAKARRLQALTDAQAVLCVVPGRLGRIEGETGESSAAGAAQAES